MLGWEVCKRICKEELAGGRGLRVRRIIGTCQAKANLEAEAHRLRAATSDEQYRSDYDNVNGTNPIHFGKG